MGLGRLRPSATQEIIELNLAAPKISSVELYLSSKESMRHSKYQSKVFLKSMHERMKSERSGVSPFLEKTNSAIAKAEQLNKLSPKLKKRYANLLKEKKEGRPRFAKFIC